MTGKMVRITIGPNKGRTGIIATEWRIGRRLFFILNNGLRASEHMIELV